MWKSQKIFRYLWRINAILILMAAGGIVLAVSSFLFDDVHQRVVQSREAASGIPVTGPAEGKESSAPLTLGRATAVKGTNIMRAELRSPGSEGKGFSSGGSASETRNVLFIEPGEKSGRWLLPDNDHVISEITDLTDDKNSMTERVMATAALIKSAVSSETPREGLCCIALQEKRLSRWQTT